MNAFANTLLTLLLGWVRTLIRNVMAAMTSEKTHGLFTWINSHWLSAVIGMIVLGTVIDFVVWLVRWQPYRLWHKKPHVSARHKQEFLRGYEHGVEGLQMDSPAPAVSQQTQPQWTAAVPPPVYEEEFFPVQPVQTVRRRRSEKYQHGLAGAVNAVKNKIYEQEDEGMIGGLSPRVDREQAFHAPVYPDDPHHGVPR